MGGTVIVLFQPDSRLRQTVVAPWVAAESILSALTISIGSLTNQPAADMLAKDISRANRDRTLRS
jgi:hypothetical protein